jgi:cysteinyl-tRNA synthetase
MLVRYLRQTGYKVFFLENITDIDDKIIKRARESRKTVKAVSTKFEKEFHKDMRSLGINSVTRYARATDFIRQILGQVKRLLVKGYAYQIEDGIYYNIAKFKNYGKLAKRTTLQAEDAVSRIDESVQKINKGDFCLWKFSKPGEPKWKSPWGWGRPGWHIEDTAISEYFFGPQYDIHGGAIDLIFPHHECEIAQQEAASGKVPFVRYWMHSGFLTVGGEKMSKSLGNFITIREILKKTQPETLRLLVALTHYRSPINYTPKLLEQTSAARESLVGFILKLKRLKPQPGLVDKLGTLGAIYKARKAFYDSLADDFNTPKALAEIFKLVARLNPLLDKGVIEKRSKAAALELLREVDDIFGIIGKIAPQKMPKNIKELVGKRETLRKEKRWQEADKIRNNIEKLGWQIEDTPSGSRLKKIQ